MNTEKHFRTLQKRADEMRSQMTKAEQKLWNWMLEGPSGIPIFQAQQVIYPYIVDFVSPEVKLVIEVDGGIHDSTRDSDSVRDAELSKIGYKVIRFSNGEILVDFASVIQRIQFECRYLDKVQALNSGTPKEWKRSKSRPMIVPLPRVVYEETVWTNFKTKASKVRTRKIANSVNGNSHAVICAICNAPIADNDPRVRHRLGNSEQVFWAHKSCK